MTPLDIPEVSIHEVIAAHCRFLLGEPGGTRADLSGIDLSAIDFRNVDLAGATLARARFGTADVTGASFRDADLRGADLSTAVGVAAHQFAGADVSGAKLPEVVAKFEGLGHLEKSAGFAEKVFLVILSGCIYCFLTIISTRDVALITNSSSLILPGVSTGVPTVPFYLTGPAVLLGLYLYFHLYLQRVWETAARLPAVWPDGRRLDEVVYPWLVTRFVGQHVPRLREGREPLADARFIAPAVLAWWLVPLLPLTFWWSYLPRHHWTGTLWHVAIAAGAIAAALVVHAGARASLRGTPVRSEWYPVRQPCAGVERIRLWVPGGVALALLLCSVFALAVFPFKTSPPLVAADLSGEKLSVVPSGWTEDEKQLPLVQGAKLEGKDLRCANLQGAVLARTHLHSADLRGADLQDADLREALLIGAHLSSYPSRKTLLRDTRFQRANLTQADLTEAELGGAQLDGAFLINANLSRAFLGKAHLHGTILINADLTEAVLQDADLTGAQLTGTILTGTNFKDAVLTGANLRGVNLRGVRNLTPEQIKVASCDKSTILPDIVWGK